MLCGEHPFHPIDRTGLAYPLRESHPGQQSWQLQPKWMTGQWLLPSNVSMVASNSRLNRRSLWMFAKGRTDLLAINIGNDRRERYYADWNVGCLAANPLTDCRIKIFDSSQACCALFEICQYVQDLPYTTAMLKTMIHSGNFFVSAHSLSDYG